MKEVAIAFFLMQLSYFAEAQITISTYPRPLHVTVGTTFTLSCNYEGHTFVSWEHPTLEVVTQNTGRVAVSNLVQVSIATLEVNRAATSADQGRYTCTARASNGQMVTQSVQATLYDAVEVTTQNNLVVSSLEGSAATVSLLCSAINHDHIAWRRVGISTELTNTTDPGHLVIMPDRLVINNVRFSDNGSYECTASNTVGFRSILSSLIVHVSASVTASPVSSTVSEESNAQFEFIVTGNPLPTVEWYKGTIGDDFRINLGQLQLTSELTSTITSVYRLTFSSVTSEDTGTYICQAHNQFGVPASAQITLQLSDALGPPQQVRATIVNQTNINVTWSRPDGTGMVDTYTVVWYSRSERPRSVIIDSGVLHYVIKEGLTRLTQYTVYVYAFNSRGKGSDSQRVNITTDAVTPVAPDEVNVHDIGPTSVRLEWVFGDDGGAPITGIRVTFITLNPSRDFVDFNISSDQTSALVPGLKDNHQYKFSVQARNRIGLGPALLTEVIRTAPPGRPGSPSHVTGTWVSGDQAALVCWEPSEVGMPFLSYTIEVRELESNVTKIWKLRVGEVKDNLPNCTAGHSVTGLIVGMCYEFKVVVSNSQGAGFPSAYSEDLCVPDSKNQDVQSSSVKPLLSTGYAVAIAVSLSVVLLVAVGVIFMWCICVRVRHSHNTAKLPTGSLPDRRSSERSNQALIIDPSHELRFQHQMSIGSYTSSGSGNSVSGENTPNTAATTVSENPFTFDGVVNSRTQQSSFTQGPDHPQSASAGRAHRLGSATLPVMNGALYPIPEDPATPSHTLPYHTTPPHYPYHNEHPPAYPAYFQTPPSSVGPCIQENFEEDVEMTDNPLNDEFEKKMLAGGNPSRPNFSHEIDLPEDEPPPYVPPYRGDDMESEISIPIGESCSQPPRSPQLSYQQQNNTRNRTDHDRSHNIMTPASFNISCSDNDDEEDSEFIDNEAYQKVQESQFLGGGFGSQNNMLMPGHCSPVVTMEGGYGSQQRMIEDGGSEAGSSKRRFKIGRNAKRGEVFEKVELRH